MSLIQEFLAHIERITHALGVVLTALRTGAPVPARDVVATLLGIPLAAWIIFLLVRSSRPRRAVRR
jgi:hypothetical protein